MAQFSVKIMRLTGSVLGENQQDDHRRNGLATFTFILRDGAQKTVQGHTGTLMEVARNAGIAGIIGECGGACACGTCHVYLCAHGLETLGPATGAEMNILEFEDNATPQSRLGSCPWAWCRLWLRWSPAFSG